MNGPNEETGESQQSEQESKRSPPPPPMQPDQRPAIERGAHLLAISTLKNAEIPFVVAGAYALHVYTGIYRDTKDLDLFLEERYVESAMVALAEAGFRTEMSDPIWIAKAHASDDYFADLIFSSGNGVAVVDEQWIERAHAGVIHGTPILVAPPEEIIWSKAFVCERERFDGTDINHLILARGKQMDWDHLLARFGDHWEVLFAHLVFYRFSYPGQRDHVPQRIWDELVGRAAKLETVPEQKRYCRGMLIARGQYKVDIEHWGYTDARYEEVDAFRRQREAHWELDASGDAPAPESVEGP